MKITFLGTGTSQGIPVIACNCKVCSSPNPKDKRLRTSVMFTFDDKNIVVDTGPDFRAQMLREKVDNIEAVLYTHNHKDHVAGLDDVRPFCFKHHKEINIFAEQYVLDALAREFEYIFNPTFNYPGIPRVNPNLINTNPFQLAGKTIIPIRGFHYKLPVLGFRVDDIAYLTDMNSIPEEELNKIKGVKFLVINALQKEPHISHFKLSESIEIAKMINAEKTFFIHMSHTLGTHDEINKELPKGIELSYDGLSVEV
jgi:phosphoribosyl 1,2-cyclic phosphate phosphodiesterase